MSSVSYSLVSHPDHQSPLCRIVVAIGRDPSGALLLTYVITGALADTVVPSPQPAARTDELWRHTCCEAFLGTAQGYYELNLSPSSQWAAYRFDAYRAGMREAALPNPGIGWTMDGDTARLTATIPLPADVTGPLGLSAVIEHEDGTKSYWALAHPPGKPDFHAAACFAAELPPAG